MILAQSVTAINYTVRRNANLVFVFRLSAESERVKIYDDIAMNGLNKGMVKEIYEFALQDTLTKDGQSMGFLTYRPFISDIQKAFYSSLKRPIQFTTE